MIKDQVFYTISEQIIHQIKNDIFMGNLKEGEPLREAPMAEKYQVSRGPVRDAFKVLAKEGLLVAKPNVGVVVAAPPSDVVLHEIAAIRLHLETFALTQSIGMFDNNDFQQFEEICNRLQQAAKSQDVETYMTLDVAFHRVIINRYGDKHIEGIWNELVYRMLFNYGRLENLEASYKEHVDIVHAIKERDIKKGIRCLSKNIQ